MKRFTLRFLGTAGTLATLVTILEAGAKWH